MIVIPLDLFSSSSSLTNIESRYTDTSEYSGYTGKPSLLSNTSGLLRVGSLCFSPPFSVLNSDGCIVPCSSSRSAVFTAAFASDFTPFMISTAMVSESSTPPCCEGVVISCPLSLWNTLFCHNLSCKSGVKYVKLKARKPPATYSMNNLQLIMILSTSKFNCKEMTCEKSRLFCVALFCR